MPGGKTGNEKTGNALTEALVRSCFDAPYPGAAGQAPAAVNHDVRGDSVRGDHDLNPDVSIPDRLRPAAVLIGLQETPVGVEIVLTRRAAHLTAHAGQISFPGGRCDVTDRDHVATALRESEEEIGLEVSAVSPLGRLDTYVTRTGFEIVPVVGWLSSDFVPRITSEEVAEVFTIPADLILRDGYPKRHGRTFEGRERTFYAFPHREWYIWGATAGMLVNLREVLITGQSPGQPDIAPQEGDQR